MHLLSNLIGDNLYFAYMIEITTINKIAIKPIKVTPTFELKIYFSWETDSLKCSLNGPKLFTITPPSCATTLVVTVGDSAFLRFLEWTSKSAIKSGVNLVPYGSLFLEGF